MIKRLFYILLILLLAIPAFGAATSYYVKQTATGTEDGKSAANAWGVAEFNSSSNWDSSDNADKIDPGDTVYFSGTITSRIVPPEGYGGSAGNYITLDGWEEGTCDPVANLGCASAAVIDRLSREDSLDNYCMRLVDNSYLIVQDFNMQDSRGGIYSNGPSSGSDPSHLIVRRNYIHNMEGKCVQHTQHASSYLSYSYLTFGGADGDGNYLYDCVEEADSEQSDSHSAGFVGDDMIISYNYMTNPSGDQDIGDESNILAVHAGNRQLIEFNTLSYPHGQACISIKEWGGTDKIVRFNKLHNCGSTGGVSVSDGNHGNKNVYVYGNFTYDSLGGYRVYKIFDEVHFWSNLAVNIGMRPGIKIDGTKTGDTPGDAYVYNNTVVLCGQDDYSESTATGMKITGVSPMNVRIKNNIFAETDYNNTSFSQIHVVSGSEARVSAMDYNTSYYTGETATYYWSGDHRSLAWIIANTAFADNSEIADPGFTDSGNDDYTLDGTNVDDGEDLSQCFQLDIQGVQYQFCLDDVLNPATTDWSTTPPTVVTCKQDNWGTAWERGAYAYPTSGLTITVSATDATATEASQTTGEWTIACSPNCAGETINYSFSGTATLDTDYDCDDEDGTIDITGASDTITLTPVDDSDYDPGEVAILTILVGAGYAVGSPNQASISIVDDDSPPVAGNPLGQLTMDSSGSGSITYNSSGSGSWTR